MPHIVRRMKGHDGTEKFYVFDTRVDTSDRGKAKALFSDYEDAKKHIERLDETKRAKRGLKWL
jgi:hypothetical protein